MHKPSGRWRIVGWGLLIAAAFVCGVLEISVLWVCVPISLGCAVGLGDALTARRIARRRAREEPIDEWIVVLDGQDVGRLANAIVTDMFWKTFTVTGDDATLFDESFWLHCRFQFRQRPRDAVVLRRPPTDARTCFDARLY